MLITCLWAGGLLFLALKSDRIKQKRDFMNSNDKDQKPADGSAGGGLLKSLFTGVIYIFAFLAAIVVKPAQALTKEAYEKNGLGGFAFLAGIILSVIGSIATGYFGWQHGIALQWWLGSAVLAPLAVFYYLWPIAYLAVGKWAFKFASFLWRNVPALDGNDKGRGKWVTYFLSGLALLAIVGGCLWGAGTIATHVHAFLGWGGFGWLIGIIVGGVVAFFGGMLACGALRSEGGMPLLAIVSGAALTYLGGFDLSSHVPSFGYANIVRHLGQGLEVFVWSAYVFPLLHIVTGRLFGWVGKYFYKLLDKTYDDSDKNYLGFLGQVLTLIGVGEIAYFSFGYGLAFGLGLWVAVPATAAVALLAYLILGGLLRSFSNVVVGVLSSLGLAYGAYFFSYGSLDLGLYQSVAISILTGAFNALLIYPLIYQGVKLLANPLFASWLGKPLVEMYKTISSQVFSSLGETYSDNTAYGPLFVQVVNIAVAYAVYLLGSELVSLIHLSTWLSLVLPALLTAASYLFVGRLLVAYKTVLISAVSSIAVGAFVGVQIFAHFDHNLWYAVPSFLAAGLAFAWAVFPVSYVVVRAALEAVKSSSWLRPILEGVYNFFFGFVQKFWVKFVVVYRKISLSFAPIWANVSKTWDDAWASAKETFDKAFNGKDKK